MTDTDYPVISEMVEPAMAHIVARLWKQVEEAKEKDTQSVEDACCTLWLAVRAINRLSTCCAQKRPGAVHFSIAAGNVMSQVSDYIKDVLGFNPWYDTDHPTAKRWNQT